MLPLLGCRSADEGGGADVVATTTQVADIARNAAGEEAKVHGILPPDADPHDYEPRPSDATAIAGAKLVLTSGGEVDAWIDELIESSGTDARVVTLLDEVPATRTDGGDTDPHWWHDPRNAIAAAQVIGEELAAADPARAASYEGNAAAYVRTLTRLDRMIADCIDLFPASARKLVTAHDSLGYFADRYGIDVVGSALPALSTQAQPSSGETAELVDLIRESGVRAVFPEAGLSGELEAAIANEANVSVGGELYADSLGEDGTAGATYAGALAANASTLAEALSNGARDCGFPGAE
ncbi:MAG: metal ABC transporter substrate-binding protein [Actinomycetota bacterium]|nr:metal ABC transporter substrate-binding protein [Actinomycetota bacterium]